tara:strand:+ start:2615 stop:2896 length:282 start_codon:yes stop_codon:yes gene_type:complete
MIDKKDSSKIIKTTEQKIAAIEQKVKMNKERARRLDTRKKIQLGGLIVKAKLDNLTSNVLLGILVDARKKLQTEKGRFEKYWAYLGDVEFNVK